MEKITQNVNWSDVQEIWTYKRDQLTVDQICIAFQYENDQAIEVNEDMEGFQDFMIKLDAIYPEIPKDWYMKVMQPAFATNSTKLWPVD